MKEWETDSDVNEDGGREKLLDDSFETWYAQMEQQAKQSEDLTRVPQTNVFDAALDLDEE